VVWEFDTAAETYNTVNGPKAKGGTLDGGGPVVAGGILYANSGYGRLIGQPGNVLLAFTVDGR
jgi:polyvinyl alcohol dehydrogenase (cytochrome)